MPARRNRNNQAVQPENLWAALLDLEDLVYRDLRKLGVGPSVSIDFQCHAVKFRKAGSKTEFLPGIIIDPFDAETGRRL